MESQSKSNLGDVQEGNADEWSTDRRSQPPASRTRSTQEEPVTLLQKRDESESGDEDETMFTSGLEDTAEAENSPQTAMNRQAHRRNTKRFRYGIETYGVI